MKTQDTAFSQVSQEQVKVQKKKDWAKILYRILVFFPVMIFFATPFFFSLKAEAATGINKQINFQGKLVDSSGLNVADSTYSVVFTLYDASSGGTNLWTETDSVTTNAGIFQVALGANNTTLGNVNFNSDSIYLGIKVGTDAEMTPRIRFSSVPYALNAGSLSGVVATQSATGFTLTGGTSTLKTMTLNDNITFNNAGLTFANGKALGLSNSLTFAGTDSTTITFQGSDTYVGRTTNDILTNKTIGSTGLTFSGASTDITTGTNEDLTIAPNGTGKVGINATTPLAAIDLRGNSGTLAVASVSGNTSFAALLVDNKGAGDLFTASSSGATRFTIEQSGNILVNTTADTADSHKLVIKAADHQLALVNGSNNVWGLANWNGTNGLYYQYNTLNKMFLSPTGSLELAANLSGSAYSPLATLDVRGNSGTTPFASFSGATTNAGMIVDNSGTGDLFTASSSGLSRFVVKQNGNVGIGTANPTSLLTLQGPQGNYLITMTDGSATSGMFVDHSLNAAMQWGTVTNNAMGFFTNDATTQMALNTNGGTTIGAYANSGTYTVGPANGLAVSGNVGIGTASPLASLDVRGTSGTTPVASVAGITAKAAFVVDNSGVGDIFTASKSGATQFVIDNNGDVGINNAAPPEKLSVNGNVLIGAQADATAHSFASGCGCLTNSAVGTFGAAGADTNRDKVSSAVVYKGKLFVATSETNLAGVYRYDGGTNPWTLVTSTTLGKAVSTDSAADADTFVMTVFNGALYIGSQTGANTGALYSSTTADTASAGDNFTLVNSARGNFGMSQTTVDGVADIMVWRNSLYILTQEPNLAELGRYDGGTTFTQINATDGKGAAELTADIDGGVLAVYQDRLYWGTQTGSTTARMYTWNGTGTAVSLTIMNTAGTFGVDGTEVDVTSMTVWDGALYVAVSKANAAAVYRWNPVPYSVDATGSNWQLVSNAVGKLASGDTANIDGVTLRTYNGRLYAGSQNATDGTGALYEYDGTKGNWTLINATRGDFNGNTTTDGISMLQEFNGTLYVGVDDGTNNKGAVYTWSKTAQNSYGLKFNSGSNNYGTISFVGNRQASDGVGHYGTFNFSNAIAMSTGAFDYAEDYPTYDPTIEAGEIVSIDPEYPEHIKRAALGDSLIGIISEKPGFRLSPTEEQSTTEHYIPVALVGRVPVKISTENGPVKAGDYLTVSSEPGVAMKATKAGQVIGQAMEDYSGGGVGKITAYVTSSQINGAKLASIIPGLSVDTTTTELAGLTPAKPENEDTMILSYLLNHKDALGVQPSADIIADRVTAGLEIVAPKVATDVISTNKIKSASDSDITMQLGPYTNFLLTDASGSAKVKFDSQGNAYFAGRILATGFDYGNSENITALATTIKKQEARLDALEAKSASSSADQTVANLVELRDTLQASSLNVANDAKVSGNLHVAGDGLIEGILNVADTLTAGKLLVNQAADFFGNVIFHGTVIFSGPPTFSDDTAGYATLDKGRNKVDVTFKKEYVTQPIINANLVSTKLTDETFSADKANGTCDQNDDMQTCQDKADKTILTDSYKYVVTNRSTKGFSIVLGNDAKETMTFSWMALSVGD